MLIDEVRALERRLYHQVLPDILCQKGQLITSCRVDRGSALKKIKRIMKHIVSLIVQKVNVNVVDWVEKIYHHFQRHE